MVQMGIADANALVVQPAMTRTNLRIVYNRVDDFFGDVAVGDFQKRQ